MARWRVITLILIVLAVGLWALLFTLNLRPELGREAHLSFPPPTGSMLLQQPLSGLPAWVASVALFITLFLAGVANLFLSPAHVRSMLRTLDLGWGRVLPIALLGIGFGLLLMVFAMGAALARITFPLTILAAFLLVFVSMWGFLSAAYALGRLLLAKAGWGRWSPAVALALGLLLLVPLIRIPLVGGVIMIIYMGLGLGLVITTRFGSNEPWSLIPLLEEDKE